MNNPTNSSQTIEARLRNLEDREEIRELLIEYGRTLDRRDFGMLAGFFSEDAEYAGSGTIQAIKGPSAIAKFVEEVFRKNPSGVRFPNFHMFANLTIQVNGDEAVARSHGLFIVPTQADTPEIVMMATNNDVLTRENGRWKFKRRVVHMEIPAPAPSQ